jgi:Fe2+ or Zn2+ uptake regulation protein
MTRDRDSAALRLRAARLCDTEPRRAVIAVLETVTSCTHPEIAHRLDDEAIDRQTIYRTLWRSESAGIVERIPVTTGGPLRWRWRLSRR